MILAFFIGLLGSVHCVGMCGPLMFALPKTDRGILSRFVQPLLYQIGRISMYCFIGLLLGLIGSGSHIQGWQAPVSVATGCILIFMALYHFLGRRIPFIAQQQQRLMTPLLNAMGFWLTRPGGQFMIGLLNGILPCGMVYLALASALNTGSALTGAYFMLSFGLGTLPLTLGTMYIGNILKQRFTFNYAKWLPSLLLVFGIWFILRGANAHIPYLSPIIQPNGIDILCH